MSFLPDSRAELRRALVLNAATKPANVLVPAAVAMAGLLLAVAWLVPVALVCGLAMSLQTFLDEGEAERVGERLRATRRPPVPPTPPAETFAPDIAERVRAAQAARVSIRRAVAGSPLGLDDVTDEVDALVLAVQGHAARAQRIREFLAERSPNELRDRDERRLARLLDEMDHVVTALRTLHGEILLADDSNHELLADHLAELRGKVESASAGLEAAFADSR
jgi:hypothetical protein